MVLDVLYFNQDAALGFDSEGWCLHLHAALNEAWCRSLSFGTSKADFFWRDLSVVRGALPSIGNMWVLALVVVIYIRFVVGAGAGSWPRIPGMDCIFSMGSAPFGRCCDGIMQTIFNGAWCRLLSFKMRLGSWGELAGWWGIAFYWNYVGSSVVVGYFTKSWKTSAVSTTVWMVETQLCKLRGTSDTFV